MTIIDLDLLLKSELQPFLVILVFTFWISTASYHTGQFFLLANQRLPFMLFVDIGYSVVLFLFWCVCTRSDFLLCSSEMCITPSTADSPRTYSPELLRKVNSDQTFPIPRDVRKKTISTTYLESRYTYENIVKTENPKLNTPENVNIKENTVKTHRCLMLDLEL